MNYYNLGNLPAKKNLLQVMREQEIDNIPPSPCGGKGTCGKCKVVVSGAVLPPDETELAKLTPDDLARGIRLACRTITAGGEVIIGLDDGGESIIQSQGSMGEFTLSPVCEAPYALAVDIGTTTVAVYLCDLLAGNIARTAAFPNPQKVFGADVIARIQAGMEDSGAYTRMKALLVGEINGAIGKFGVSGEDIGYAVLTGNPTMLHILSGFDPTGLANAPFTPASLFGFTVSAESLGLALPGGVDCYLPPCFSAYVGADVATGIVAAGCDLDDGISLYIDVGTNGEMGLRTPEGFTLCATATGPAFEGAHISCGMSGLTGAISRVWTQGDQLALEVIGGGTPKGICGSGLIDAAAAMLELEILDETGYLEDDPYPLTEDESVYLTGKDVRELQLAKAAVAAGIMTLLEDCGYTLDDIEHVYVAGGFGAHIDPDSACRIGLFPAELREKIRICGNTAGSGAALYTLSADARARVEALPAKCRYLELSGNAVFMENYVEGMMFE